MNADRFDAMIHALTAASPRRTTLGGALGAGLAALLSRLGIEDAEARRKRRKKKKKCNGGKKKCGKRCRNLATDGNNCGACKHDCLSGECERGACLCAGQQECPLGCYCLPRLNVTGGACGANGLIGGTCEDDDDCPFGAVCRLGGVCTVPCLL